jgi:D-alanyl-D-alanine carboxypeptidase/D-alanyl-D-alanine-endopeptidase (penicillin-binding protein 4)
VTDGTHSAAGRVRYHEAVSEPQEPQSPDSTTPQPSATGQNPVGDAPLTRREAREAAKAEARSAGRGRKDKASPDGAAPPDPAVAEGAPTVAMSFDELAGAGAAPEPNSTAPKSAGRKASTGGIGGLAALIAKHPNAWLFSALGVVFVLLGTGAVFAGTALTSASAVTVVTSPSPTATTPPPRPTPAAVAAATRLRTCSIAGLVADPRLGTFEGSVLNAATGEVLFDRAAGTGAPTASVMKTLIAATALKVLGPDYQFSTKVYAGSEPGSVVLVGGGDATLRAGGNSVYQGAPQLSDLAAQVTGARGLTNPPITKIILDASMWNNSDSWDPSWPANERTLGYQPLIVPLMVDGDRANPNAPTSPRSTDPVGNAGKAFAAALGVSGADISNGSAITTNKLLGEVKSQSVKTLIGQMLPNSDNTLAEMLARVSSKVSGHDGSAASLTAVVTKALGDYGIAAPGLVIKDGSGESKNDAVPPLVVAQLMVKVLAGANSLDVIYNALPVSGKTGTLSNRFSGANAVARGAVNAKTGSIANVYTLGGIVHAADGTALAFAFYAFGNVRSTAMAAIDTVTTGVFKCGDNLSNN